MYHFVDVADDKGWLWKGNSGENTYANNGKLPFRRINYDEFIKKIHGFYRKYEGLNEEKTFKRITIDRLEQIDTTYEKPQPETLLRCANPPKKPELTDESKNKKKEKKKKKKGKKNSSKKKHSKTKKKDAVKKAAMKPSPILNPASNNWLSEINGVTPNEGNEEENLEKPINMQVVCRCDENKSHTPEQIKALKSKKNKKGKGKGKGKAKGKEKAKGKISVKNKKTKGKEKKAKAKAKEKEKEKEKESEKGKGENVKKPKFKITTKGFSKHYSRVFSQKLKRHKDSTNKSNMIINRSPKLSEAIDNEENENINTKRTMHSGCILVQSIYNKIKRKLKTLRKRNNNISIIEKPDQEDKGRFLVSAKQQESELPVKVKKCSNNENPSQSCKSSISRTLRSIYEKLKIKSSIINK